MIKNYFTTAFRNLFRNKVYSFINISGLSLGLACAMLIILYTKDELSFDRFHKNIPQIYRIVYDRVKPDGSIEKAGISGTFQGPKFTAAIPELQSFVRFNSTGKTLKQGVDIVSKQVYVADSSFFSIFTFPLLSGNPGTALKEPNSVVISETMAKEQFGTVDALGKFMFFKEGNKFEPYTVTGVAKNTPQNSSIRFDILMPLRIDPNFINWGFFYINTFVVVAPNANIKLVEAKMNKVYREENKEQIKKMEEKFGEKPLVYSLQPFTDIHLSKDYKADNGLSSSRNTMYSYILSGIALFILLIACINFVNLTIARSIKRAKEIGIRKVVGGDRKQLIVQLLSESFALSFAAFLLAILIVQAVLPIFNQLANKALYLSYLLDAKLVAGYAVLFLVTGLLTGFYPALVLSNYNPVQTLYNRFTLSGKSYLQKGLVVFQFSLATLMIVATITIYSQFNYLTHKELGYDDKNVVIIGIPQGVKPNEALVFKEELLKSPNIISIAFKDRGYSGTSVKVNGETEINATYETIDVAYLPLYKIPIVKGRNFSVDFPSDSSNSVLVNETFVRQAGWKQPIGQIAHLWKKDDKKYTVVGVVKDHYFRSLAEEIEPQLFTINVSNNGYGLMLIRIKPNSEATSLEYIEKAFKKLFPVNPYTYSFKDLENLRNYEAEAKWKQMIFFGALITIFISSIGLFGLSLLSAEKRTKEIGIRKVLGASVGRVVTTLSTDFLQLVTIAMLIAMPVAWLLADKWLQNYPYRISLSWWTFAAAGILVVLIALATVSFQAIKAAIANPVNSLRSE